MKIILLIWFSGPLSLLPRYVPQLLDPSHRYRSNGETLVNPSTMKSFSLLGFLFLGRCSLGTGPSFWIRRTGILRHHSVCISIIPIRIGILGLPAIKRREIEASSPSNIVIDAPGRDFSDLVPDVMTGRYAEDVVHFLHRRDLSSCTGDEEPYQTKRERIQASVNV